MKEMYIETGRNYISLGSLGFFLFLVSINAFNRVLTHIFNNDFNFNSLIILLLLGFLPFICGLISLKYIFVKRTRLLLKLENDRLIFLVNEFPSKEFEVLNEISLNEIMCPLRPDEIVKNIKGVMDKKEKVIYMKKKDGTEVEVFKTLFPLSYLTSIQIIEIYKFVSSAYSEEKAV